MDWRQNQPLPFQNLFILPLSWATFLLVTVFGNVWTCDCYFFADFLMVRALLLKKNTRLKLNSFSIQLEAHQDNWNTNVWKRTETRAMKKRAPELKPHYEIVELRSWSHVHEKKSSGAVSFLRRLRSPANFTILTRQWWFAIKIGKFSEN